MPPLLGSASGRSIVSSSTRSRPTRSAADLCGAEEGRAGQQGRVEHHVAGQPAVLDQREPTSVNSTPSESASRIAAAPSSGCSASVGPAED